MKSFDKSGAPFIWLTGGALAFCLLMIAGLVGVVLYNGLGFFWPSDLVALRLKDGTSVLGQVWDRQEIPGSEERSRIQVKVGNRDVYGIDFRWIEEDRSTRMCIAYT